MKRLALLLNKAHGFNGSVWSTDYNLIPGLTVRASTTNGTSGIGSWKRQRVYWHYNHLKSAFEVEAA